MTIVDFLATDFGVLHIGYHLASREQPQQLSRSTPEECNIETENSKRLKWKSTTINSLSQIKSAQNCQNKLCVGEGSKTYRRYL